MATALNFTARIKQDEESQQRLQQIVGGFAQHIQPAMEAALRAVETVHYARVVVIDNKYIQVLTEFDGDPFEYTEFFRLQLPDVFKAVFALVEGAPSWDQLNNPNTFFELSSGYNLAALGESTDGQTGRGYLFSAYGDTTVREILAKVGPTP